MFIIQRVRADRAQKAPSAAGEQQTPRVTLVDSLWTAGDMKESDSENALT